MDIPIIDCSNIIGCYDSVDEKELNKISKEFGDAMSGIGFAYLINHGINMKTVEINNKMFKSFYEMPNEIKLKYLRRNSTENFHGYTAPGDELLNEHMKNSTELRECYNIAPPKQFEENGYPSELPGLKSLYDSLRSDCNNLSKKLLKCLGKYLELSDEDFFLKSHKFFEDPTVESYTQFETIYYFPLEFDEIPENAIRCGEHSDWGTITLLFQDMVGGLEVKRTNGEWVQATPIKDSILINSGQLLEMWSAGRFPATLHRVRIVNDERLLKNARQSLVYFVNPDSNVAVSPIVPPITGAAQNKFSPNKILKAGDHFRRLAENATIHRNY